MTTTLRTEVEQLLGISLNSKAARDFALGIRSPEARALVGRIRAAVAESPVELTDEGKARLAAAAARRAERLGR